MPSPRRASRSPRHAPRHRPSNSQMLTRSLSRSISNLSQCSGPSTSDKPTGPSNGREAAELDEFSSRKRGHSRERYRPTKRVRIDDFARSNRERYSKESFRRVESIDEHADCTRRLQRLKERYDSLDTEYSALRAAHAALTTAHESLTQAIGKRLLCESAPNGPTSTSSLPTPPTVLSVPEKYRDLDRKNAATRFPDINFWTLQDFNKWDGERNKMADVLEVSNKKPQRGNARAREGENVMYHFVEEEDGGVVDGHVASAIRKLMQSIFNGMGDRVPQKWRQAGKNDRDYVLSELYKAYPYLMLCFDHWKADKIASNTLSTFHNNTQKRRARLAPVVKQEMKPNMTPPPTSHSDMEHPASNPISTSPLSPASPPPPPVALTAEPAVVNTTPVIPSLPLTSTTDSTATHAMPLVNDVMTLPTPNTMPIIPPPTLPPVTDSPVAHATPLLCDTVNLPSSAVLPPVSGPDDPPVIPPAQQGVPLTPDGDSPLGGEELENHHNAALPARLARPVGTRPLVNPLSKHFGAPSAPSKRLTALRKVQDSKASQAKSASSAKAVDTPSKHGTTDHSDLVPGNLKKVTKSNAPKNLCYKAFLETNDPITPAAFELYWKSLTKEQMKHWNDESKSKKAVSTNTSTTNDD